MFNTVSLLFPSFGLMMTTMKMTQGDTAKWKLPPVLLAPRLIPATSMLMSTNRTYTSTNNTTVMLQLISLSWQGQKLPWRCSPGWGSLAWLVCLAAYGVCEARMWGKFKRQRECIQSQWNDKFRRNITRCRASWGEDCVCVSQIWAVLLSVQTQEEKAERLEGNNIKGQSVWWAPKSVRGWAATQAHTGRLTGAAISIWLTAYVYVERVNRSASNYVRMTQVKICFTFCLNTPLGRTLPALLGSITCCWPYR